MCCKLFIWARGGQDCETRLEAVTTSSGATKNEIDLCEKNCIEKTETKNKT